MKIVIGGYPNSGKTTLANILTLTTGYEILPTDKLLETHDWHELSAEVSTWFDLPGSWILEGVAAARSIRKWHLAHPDRRAPFDMFIYMRRELGDARPGQRSMSHGMDTVMKELWHWMIDSNVIVFELGPGRVMDQDPEDAA